MLAMSLNSSVVCSTQTRLRKGYATGHGAVAIPPRLLKEQPEKVTEVVEQPTIIANNTAPETRNVNGQELKNDDVGMLAALPEISQRLNEEERSSFDENTAIALERHDAPPEERNVDGDNILPFGRPTRNLFRGQNTEGSLETIEKVRYNDDG